MVLHSHVAGLCPLADPEWRRKLWTVGLWLFVPFVGWAAALGYRTHFVRQLLGARPSALPETRHAFWACALDGLRAIGVIFSYLAPLYLLLFALVGSRGWQPGGLSLYLTIFFVAYPIFSTLSLPIALLLFALGEPALLTPNEAVLFFAGYGLLVFIVPAGFLEVSRSGRYRSAFALQRSLPFLLRHWPAYAQAWFTSGLMGLVGHCVVPVAPWGVAWSYLGIIFNFNEILLADDRPIPRQGFDRLLADPRFHGRGHIGLACVLDAGGESVAILDLGLFSVPLPRWPRRTRTTS